MEIRAVLETQWKTHGDFRAARALGNIYEHVFRDVEALVALHRDIDRYLSADNPENPAAGTAQTAAASADLSLILARRIERLGGRRSKAD